MAPLLFMVTLLAAGPARGNGFAAFYALATGIGALVALVVAGRLVLRPLFQLVAQTKQQRTVRRRMSSRRHRHGIDHSGSRPVDGAGRLYRRRASWPKPNIAARSK